MSVKRSSVRPSSAPRPAPRLKDRRRQGRRRLVGLLVVLVFIIVGTALYGLRQEAVRISAIEVRGADALLPGASPADLAKRTLVGSYLGLIPHDSTFFYPAHRIRVAIISAHPEIAAISFAHQGLKGLIIKISLRTPVGRWCGVTRFNLNASSTRLNLVTPCYLYDPNGFMYSAVPETDASSTPSVPETLNSFTLYAPLVGNVQEPLRATVVHAAQLPDAFAFARQLASFGSAANAVVIHGDEADILLASGTRVTYVLRHEEAAYSALTSAKENMNLANDSIDYIDLRFPGKVYLKKRVDSQQETVNSQ